MFDKKILKDILKFAIPLITGQVGQMLLGVGDMMVAGRYSKEVVSAMGIASAVFGPFLMLGLGLSYAIAPMLAKKMGEGKKAQSFLFSTLVYCFVFSLLIMFSMQIFLSFGMSFLKLAPNIEKIFIDYFQLVLFSMLPILIFQGIKEYLQVQKDIWFANILVIIANISNVILNIVLCFGLFGFPEMGARGLAISTVLNRVLMMLALLYYVRHEIVFEKRIYKDFLYDCTRLGFPISLAILMEVSIFTVVTVLIGRMDVLTSAAHNIILNVASFTFMVPLALGNAASTLVALSLAEHDFQKVKKWAYGSLFLALMFALTTTSVFVFLPKLVLSVYTDKMDVILKGCTLIVFAGLFQIPDGLQATLSGVLRGMRITKPTMILTMIGYWVIGLPLGYYLAFYRGLLAEGLWIGLASSLASMMVLLFFLLRFELKKLT